MSTQWDRTPWNADVGELTSDQLWGEPEELCPDCGEDLEACECHLCDNCGLPDSLCDCEPLEEPEDDDNEPLEQNDVE